jgi:ribosomal-protein-alanine N-acetyltransferase
VREFFPGLQTREESDASIDRFERGFERHGFGLWAVEVVDSGEFIGFTGLSVPSFEAHFTPAVEVGWRLARTAWGHGFATEAARVALRFGFENVGLDEIVSFTPPGNSRSQAVMRRIGMSHDPADDFDHPRFAKGDRLCRHVLYRITVGRWRSSSRGQRSADRRAAPQQRRHRSVELPR